MAKNTDELIIAARTKAAVLKLLASGEVSVPEAAWAVGYSRQMVHNWAVAAKINVAKARWDYVRRVVARECANKVTEPSHG
jgi:hypothetical protein